MDEKKDFPAVFAKLKAILKPYARTLVVVADSQSLYYLDTTRVMKNKKPLFFGSVRVGKAYVSFHLMLVYVYPDLVKSISPELKKRMQGKSCFNFTSVDEKLFKELARLTRASVARYKSDASILNAFWIEPYFSKIKCV